MANIKFSAFTQKVTQANVDFLVGYTGADNVRITPAALGDGIYLPLGGGTMVGNLKLNDSVRLEIGTNADGEFWHDGNDLYMTNTTGDMYLTNKADDKDIIFQSDDGSGGYATYFFLDGSATNGTSVLGATKFPDKSKIYIGSGADLEIFHDGSNTYLENYTGDFIFTQAANDKDIQFKSDDGAGGTTLYYYLDGSIVRNRFPKNVYLEDNVKLLFGDASTPDLEIYHDTSNSYIRETGTGNMYIQASERIRFTGINDEALLYLNENSNVEAYYDNALKLETTATGIQVTDEVSIGTNLVHTGDTDTKLAFSTNNISLIAGGATHFIAESDQTTILYSGNAQTLFCDTNQRVGIGTTSPAYALHVDMTAAGATNPSYIVSDSGGVFTMAIGTQNSPGVAQEAFVGTLSNTDFKIMANSAFVGRMTTTGRLMVGSGGVPEESIQAGGAIVATATNVTSSTAGTNRAIMDLTSGGARLGHFRGTTAAGSGSVKLYSDSVLGITLDASQNVSIQAAKNLYLDGGSDTYITESSDGVIDFYGDTKLLLTLKQNGTQSEVVVNESSFDCDFRVESNGDTHALFVQGSDSYVGIGTNAPTAALQVVGLAEHADNAAALTAGLTAGAFYRTGDLLKVVH